MFGGDHKGVDASVRPRAAAWIARIQVTSARDEHAPDTLLSVQDFSGEAVLGESVLEVTNDDAELT